MRAHLAKRFFPLLAWGLLAGMPAARAAFDFTPGCREAYGNMVRLRFDAARSALANERQANPVNFIPHYVESYIDFLTAFISEQRADFDTLRARRNVRLDRLGIEDRQSPYYLLVRAELYLQTAVVHVKFRENLTAVYEFRKAYKLLEANARKHPSFLPNAKCLGILHALIGYVPSNYKWLTRLLGFRGTIPQGLGELNTLLKASEREPRYRYLYDETAILLMFLEFHLDKDNKAALALAERIGSGDPGPLHLFSMLSIYLYAAMNDKAIALLDRRSPDPGEYPFHYLDFMHGLSLLNKLDPRARPFFKDYLASYTGTSFIKSACQKLAWLSLVEGDTAGYRSWMREALVRGDDFTDEDKHALSEARKGDLPNGYLLRARLLFDGGYYRESLAVLAGKDIVLFPRFRDQLEFTYRLARIYDRLGLRDKAIDLYRQTVRNGESYTFYFAANAALCAGQLYERENDAAEAASWYRKCLAMRNHEYQDSIDQRAEAGLNRLGAR